MIKDIKITVNLSKGSPLTGSCWADIFIDGDKYHDRTEITSEFDHDPNAVETQKLEFVYEHNTEVNNVLTVVNHPDTIGPMQIWNIDFQFKDAFDENENPIWAEAQPINWYYAVKKKPLRFGGNPQQTITNPHVDPGPDQIKGWSSVTEVSPGMSISWSLKDLVYRP